MIPTDNNLLRELKYLFLQITLQLVQKSCTSRNNAANTLNFLCLFASKDLNSELLARVRLPSRFPSSEWLQQDHFSLYQHQLHSGLLLPYLPSIFSLSSALSSVLSSALSSALSWIWACYCLVQGSTTLSFCIRSDIVLGVDTDKGQIDHFLELLIVDRFVILDTIWKFRLWI